VITSRTKAVAPQPKAEADVAILDSDPWGGRVESLVGAAWRNWQTRET
jgi:hypothetical protein